MFHGSYEFVTVVPSTTKQQLIVGYTLH